MKTTQTRRHYWWLAVLISALAVPARADNGSVGGCVDQPSYGPWTCSQQGTVNTTGSLTSTNYNICVGGTVTPPGLSSNPTFNNGQKTAIVHHTCIADGYETDPVVYTAGSLYFDPPIPNVFWTPGVYTYAAKVIATCDTCLPLTNTVSIVTVNVGTNTPDVLFDVVFGNKTITTKAGYAAIGNGPGDYWNSYAATGYVSGVLANLQTVEGYVSPVGLAVTNLPFAGTNASSDAMYGNYLSAASGQQSTLTLTNLPTGTWNVFLYASDGSFQLSAGTNNYGTQTCFDQTLFAVLWQQGTQYVVFTNVVITNGQPLTITVNPGSNGVAMISGLQIASKIHIHAPPPLASPISGIVSWWRAENNALDSIGTNNGTLMGGASYTNGMVNRGFYLNGSNAYVQIPDSASLKPTNVTVEAWVWLDPNASPSSLEYIVFKKNSWPYLFEGYSLLKENRPNGNGTYTDRFSFVITSSGNQKINYSTTAVQRGVWYHVAGTYDRSSGYSRLYVNGVLESSIYAGFELDYGTRPVFIGTSGEAFDGKLAGIADEISIYNRALATNEIAAIYNAGAAGKPSVPADSDYDGVSDAQELADRTDPNNPNSVTHICLGYWPFDNTNTWVGGAGQLPLLVTTNVIGVPSWATNAALIDATNAAILNYRDVETNGNANINLRSGTIRFWFKPDWTSTDQDGAGPQSEGRLIEMGTEGSTNGWWGLLVNSSGTNIYFGTQTNSTDTLTTNLTAPISWASGIWHQVVFTYNSTNTSLYLDGQAVMTNGSGVAYYPGLAVRVQGFRIGGDADGNNQAGGVFDELATFNYQLDAGWIGTDYTNYLSLLPSIAAQPSNQTTVQGSNATFNVTAIGMAPLSYQWQFNGDDIPGATGISYTNYNVQPSDAGSYSALVINNAGSINSADAELTVVGMSRIIVDGSNPENQGPVFACSGGPITLRAMPDPSGVSFPSGFPVWTIMSQPSGSSIADPAAGSPTAAITPVVLGQYVIQAACGTSLTTCTINCVGQSDSDYDGISDCEEVSDGTDPTDPTSVLPVRLAYWSFDNTNTWIGDQGQLPLSAAYITGVSSWNTNAVEISAANAVLAYRDVEANAGHANINLQTGTIRLWFRPDWSSTDAGGVGPQAEARLIEIGSKGATGGWWGLVIDMSGTNVYFGTQTNSALTLTTNLSAAISWSSNTWHQIVLAYSTNNSLLYLDGEPVATNGLAVACYPGAGVRTQGFAIGGSVSGANQAQGTFDELETFNYMLDAASIQLSYQAAINLDSDGDGWPNIIENMFGTEPNNPSSVPQGITIDHPSDGSVISR
jgi:hypothetical protein